MFSIGALTLQYPFLLAPMSGVSDLAFRLISRELGCPLAFGEMVNAKALGMKNDKTIKYLRSSPLDSPLGVQLLANDADSLLRGLEVLQNYSYDLLDFNAACPVPKVTRKGEGAALLKEPEHLSRLVRTLVAHAGVPVTVKIRSGWDDTSINAPEIARRIEDAGAHAICIHGRTRKQGYGGRVDLGVIRDVKSAVRIPVIGSGDLFSAGLAARMQTETGCDGVMVARGAWGNPWIFRDLTNHYEERPPAPAPGLDELRSVMRRHLTLSVECHGGVMGVVNFRKFFIWYTRGLVRARLLRERAGRINTIEEMNRLIDVLQMGRVKPLALPASRGSVDPIMELPMSGLI